MILYNVTVKIDEAVHEEWLEWMKTVHVPDVMNTGMFVENKLCRLLSVDEADGISYAIQYLAPDQAHFDRYQQDFAPSLQREHKERYKDKFVAFRTLMEVLHTA